MNRPLHALLIGIDHYLPNELPDGTSYPNLRGSVRDVAAMERFLRCRRVPAERIITLTATDVGSDEPAEERERWPTCENMVTAIKHLTATAEAGDRVLIHYSGHGGRIPTCIPEVKGRDGLDEALVPVDVGNPEARYLRDVELAQLLRTMVERRLVVTLILDSCYSGGATRGRAEIGARGIGRIDLTRRPTGSLVAGRQVLAETWRRLAGGVPRQVRVANGWLPAPRGYVLLAACQASETAWEYPFDDEGHHGVLTWSLLEALRQGSSDLTYRQLHRRIIGGIRGRFEGQTPVLEGEATWLVCADGRTEERDGIVVLDVEPEARRVCVNTGQAQGVHKGTLLGICSPDRPDDRLAVVEATQCGAVDSWATVRTDLGPARIAAIRPGAIAVVVDPGRARFRRRVRTVSRPGWRHRRERRALTAVERLVAGRPSGFLELADETSDPDFQVAVNIRDEYEIRSTDGHPLPHLRPPLAIRDGDAPGRLVERLMHLARYCNVRKLDNDDPTSPLRGALTVALARPQAETSESPRSVPTLVAGETIRLTVKNASRQVLYVVVLDLRPDWSIEQIHPPPTGSVAEQLDPGRELRLPLTVYLPPGYQHGHEVLKVVGTVNAVSFRWLELPAIDHPADLRRIEADPFAGRDWTVAQVELKVVHEPDSLSH